MNTKEKAKRIVDDFLALILSPVGYAIWRALDNPKDWDFHCEPSGYTIKHNPTMMSFWVANGVFFFDGYRTYMPLEFDENHKMLPKKESPPIASIGLFERHVLYWKYKRAKKQVQKERNEEIAKILNGGKK